MSLFILVSGLSWYDEVLHAWKGWQELAFWSLDGLGLFVHHATPQNRGS